MALASLPAIQRLHLAEMTCPEFHPTPGEEVEVFGYLIEHPEGPVLVDIGIGSGNDFLDRSYRPRRVALADALAVRGRQLSDVVALINSHLHFDHCGNNRDLSGVPTWVQQREVEAAREPHYTVREWFDFDGADLHIVGGKAEVLPGLRLVPTPGHTPGHQSLVVEGGGRRAVVIAQAAYTFAEWGSRADPEQADPREGFRASYVASFENLRRLEPDQVFLSHDRRTGAP